MLTTPTPEKKHRGTKNWFIGIDSEMELKRAMDDAKMIKQNRVVTPQDINAIREERVKLWEVLFVIVSHNLPHWMSYTDLNAHLNNVSFTPGFNWDFKWELLNMSLKGIVEFKKNCRIIHYKALKPPGNLANNAYKNPYPSAL